jgi:hypothetical protein
MRRLEPVGQHPHPTRHTDTKARVGETRQMMIVGFPKKGLLTLADLKL